MSRIYAAAVLAIAILFSACTKKSEAPAISVARCFNVQTYAYPHDGIWQFAATNTCNQAFPNVYFLIKYMNAFGERIGVAVIAANYVGGGERILHDYDLPKNLANAVFSVQLRKISSDPQDALR